MPRVVFLLGVGMALLAVAFVLTHELLGPRPGVTEANVRRLRDGISPEEAEAILGIRALRRRVLEVSWGRGEAGIILPGRNGEAEVWFYADGRVKLAEWSDEPFIVKLLPSP
jgi:hypothetical protein